MKAAFLSKLNKPLTIKENIYYKALQRGQVLVKIKYTGVCKSQVYEIYGGRNNKKYIPHLLGHEATGFVIKKHPSVKKFKKNDRVILTWLKCSGIQAENPSYFYENIKVNSGSVTTFSSESIVSENRLIKLPTDISFRKGVILGCAFPTGAGIILNHIKKTKGKKIAFIGLGGVGVSALLAALNLDLKEICAFDINLNRIQKLKKDINQKKINFYFFSKENKNKFINYFDYVVETSGTTEGIESGLSLINNKGKLIFASHPNKNKRISIDPFELIKGKKIFGSWGGEVNYSKQKNILFSMFRRIKNFEKIFMDNIYSFSNINKAIADLRSNKVLRPIIKF
jgi:S-(hydroxymethyl)glutathione dehydrogenase/alcohol dehydrogenase